MKKFSDYDSVEVKDFGTYEKLKLGFPIEKDEFMYVKKILENGLDFYESVKML